MARIPVERERGGSPWWLWLLGLLLLAGLIWLLAELFGPDETADEVVEGEAEQAEPTAPSGGAVITDPAQILTTTEPASLVGRRVELEGLRVVAAQGDSLYVVEMAGATTGDTAASPTGAELPDAMDTTEAGAADADTTMNNRILVVRRDMGATSPGPATGDPSMPDVTVGDMVRVEGTIQELDETMVQRLNIPGVDMDELAQNGLYIAAEEITPMDESTGGAPDTTQQPE